MKKSNFLKAMSSLNKLSLPLTLIMSSLILGSFLLAIQITKQNSFERQQRIDIEQRQKEEAILQTKEEQEKNDLEKNLQNCLTGVTDTYVVNWLNACELAGSLTKDCITLKNTSFDDYAKAKSNSASMTNLTTIADDFLKERKDCLCALPTVTADRLEETVQDSKAECYKRYSQQ